jgi:hypothetical protein
MNKIVIGVLASAILTACGPSKEEMAAREKVKMDSVAVATTENLAKEQAKQDSIVASNENQIALKQQLIDLKAQLEAAMVKLNDTEQFKLLRTESEKEQQVEEQTRAVEELKAQIAEIEKQII